MLQEISLQSSKISSMRIVIVFGVSEVACGGLLYCLSARRLCVCNRFSLCRISYVRAYFNLSPEWPVRT